MLSVRDIRMEDGLDITTWLVHAGDGIVGEIETNGAKVCFDMDDSFVCALDDPRNMEHYALKCMGIGGLFAEVRHAHEALLSFLEIAGDSFMAREYEDDVAINFEDGCISVHYAMEVPCAHDCYRKKTEQEVRTVIRAYANNQFYGKVYAYSEVDKDGERICEHAPEEKTYPMSIEEIEKQPAEIRGGE